MEKCKKCICKNCKDDICQYKQCDKCLIETPRKTICVKQK
jgi:hypothetical protein